MKRRKRTSQRVPAKGRLKDMADRLWSCAVRRDWAERCAICGRGAGLNAHHLIPRQHAATRYALENGCCLCTHCHQFCPTCSPHQNAAGWLHWLTEHHPGIAAWYQEANQNAWARSQTVTKNAQFYCTTIRQLREYVEDDDYRRIVGVRLAEWLEEEE